MTRLARIFILVVLVATLVAEYGASTKASALELVLSGTVELVEVVDTPISVKAAKLPNLTAVSMNTSTDAMDVMSIQDILAFLADSFTADTQQYRATPAEDFNPIEWIDPWQTKERMTTSWLPLIESVLASGDYPNVDAMLVMGIIAQENGGDPNMPCQTDICLGVGLMAIVPQPWTGTEAQLRNVNYNLRVGISMINTIYDQALEHGFRPGREATRAALAGYNCGWVSLLADKCYSFGGWMYADKVLFYWTPLLEKYLEEQNGS